MTGRRAGQRFDAELGVTTEALVLLGELDPEAIGDAMAHATHYEPTPVAELGPLLDAVPFESAGATFIDLGCGMGRVVLLAARRPYRRVVGVEVSPALLEIARENLAATRDDPQRRCRDVRVVGGDAADWSPPLGDLVVYLYNPFGAPVVARVLAALERDARGRTALVYHTPVERATVEARGRWELVAEIGDAAVWTLA